MLNDRRDDRNARDPMVHARSQDLAGLRDNSPLRSGQEQYQAMDAYVERPDAPSPQNTTGSLKRRRNRLSTGLTAVAGQQQELRGATAPRRDGPKPASARKKRSK